MEAHVVSKRTPIPFAANLERFAKLQPQVAFALADLPLKASRAFLKQAEVDRWFARLPLEKTLVLYVYGVGDGSAYRAAESWLRGSRKRSLVFLEDDWAEMRAFLETETANVLLHDPQVRLYGFRDVDGDELLFNNIAWDYVLKPFHVATLPRSTKGRSGLLKQLRERLTYEHHRKGEIAQEYLDQGIVFYQNFYPNVLHLHECYLGDALFDQFKGIPAIICGAGPSLAKQLPLLRRLRDRALIFAGGSAVNALTAAHITPHFGCGIDPNFAQVKRLNSSAAFEVPFFFRGRMHHRAFRAIQGPKLYVTGTGGYETARYIEEQIGLTSSELDEGHNVVNFSVSLAERLGCHPIIFVGLDMAYTGMRGYSSGVVADAKVTVKDIKKKGIDDAAVVRPDIYGKPIYTLWKWIDESAWLANYAKEHPGLSFFNATEGGLGIEGVPNVSLQQVVDKALARSWDLDGLVWSHIQNATLPVGSRTRVRKALLGLRDSLKRCQQLIEEACSGIPALRVVAEVEIEQEPAFEAILSTFQACIDRMLLHEAQGLDWRANVGGQERLLKAQEALLKRRYTFLLKVARSHIALIDYAMYMAAQESAMKAPPTGVKGNLKVETIGGYSRFWNAAGVLLSECRYVKGQREGPCRRFYANGRLYAEEHYHNGQLVGMQNFYYPNGQLKSCVEITKGVATQFRPDGTIKRKRKLGNN